MTHPFARVIGAWLAVLVSGCAATGPDIHPDDDRCPQTCEFGNSGCAVLAVRLIGPDGTAVNPPQRLNSTVILTLAPITPGAAFAGYHTTVMDTSWQELRATRYFGPPPAGPDTVTVWLRALWRNAPSSDPDKQPPPVYAVDSIVRQILLVPVGQRFVKDTVVMRLRELQASAPW